MALAQSIQDLPPRWARLCLDVERFVSRELNVEPFASNVLVALSGGPDSSALLLVSLMLARKNHGSVRAAHLDHGLRPESGLEAEAVRRLCAELKVPLSSEKQDVSGFAREKGLGLEEAARDLRYEFLERTRAAQEAEFILLGHQLDDLAEDVLMRLVRGAGWPGLAGMPALDRERRVLRPLLLLPKAELKAFLSDLGLAWIEDPSNESRDMRRNRFRRAVLPLIVEENPGFSGQIIRLWRQGRLDADYWDRLLDRAASAQQDLGPDLLLPRAEILAAHKALRLRWYKRALDGLGPGQVLADSLLALDAALVQGRIGTVHRFPGGKSARVAAEGVVFSVEDR